MWCLMVIFIRDVNVWQLIPGDFIKRDCICACYGVLKIILSNTWQTLQYPNNGRFSQAKEIFSAHITREYLDSIVAFPQSLKWFQDSSPHIARRRVSELNIVLSRFLHEHTKLWSPSGIMDGADVLASLVRNSHTPVKTNLR